MIDLHKEISKIVESAIWQYLPQDFNITELVYDTSTDIQKLVMDNYISKELHNNILKADRWR